VLCCVFKGLSGGSAIQVCEYIHSDVVVSVCCGAKWQDLNGTPVEVGFDVRAGQARTCCSAKV
jgi:hypothetical protein